MSIRPTKGLLSVIHTHFSFLKGKGGRNYTSITFQTAVPFHTTSPVKAEAVCTFVEAE